MKSSPELGCYGRFSRRAQAERLMAMQPLGLAWRIVHERTERWPRSPYAVYWSRSGLFPPDE